MEQTTNRDVAASGLAEHLLSRDRFSQWLGIRILAVREGYSHIEMVVREEMVNGFGIVHGGIPFSFADSAFAFACNNRNRLSLALDASITFTKPIAPGDVLRAEVRELHDGRQTGLYLVEITNQRNQQVALFKGTCFRTGSGLLQQMEVADGL